MPRALLQVLLASPGRGSERVLQILANVVAERPVPRARAPTREVLRRYLVPACAAALELWETGTVRGLSWGAPDPRHALAVLTALARPT